MSEHQTPPVPVSNCFTATPKANVGKELASDPPGLATILKTVRKNGQVPKFSIMVPVKNGMPYLVFALNSVLNQGFDDAEIIVSIPNDDHSSLDFVRGLNDSRLRVLECPPGLSMTEHWDWVQKHATGAWQMYLGQDDGVQENFFTLADRLVDRAEDLNLKLIASKRAYIHWPESRFDPDGRGLVKRQSGRFIYVRNLRKDSMAALIGNREYFALPQMYTTSLFRSCLLREFRAKQGGPLLTCHPQDANLAAISRGFETRYLFSEVPLGWVGTSKKSAGAAISSRQDRKSAPSREESELSEQYLSSISSSAWSYPEWAGSFELSDVRIYFWQALLMTRKIQPKKLVWLIQRGEFIQIMLGRCAAASIIDNRPNRDQLGLIAKRNGTKLGILFRTATSGFLISSWLRSLALKGRLVIKSLITNKTSFLLPNAGQSPAGMPTVPPFQDGRTPLGRSALPTVKPRNIRRKKNGKSK